MDEIIGLLFLVVPVIFSLIGKKLEKASEGKPADGLPQADLQDAGPQPEESSRETFRRVEPFKSDVQVKARTKAFRPSVREDEKPRKKDPIDPKKLVIYSEIMKPKFTE